MSHIIGGEPLARFLARELLVEARPVLSTGITSKNPLTATLQVWLTGTGTPAPVAGRAGPSNFVQLGEQTAVVDCGSGTGHRLTELGVDLGRLDYVFLTHSHFDHNIDLGFLLMSPWVRRIKYQTPIIVGPPGTLEFVNRILWSQHYDMLARIPQGYEPQELAVEVVEVEDGRTIEGKGWRCTPFRVEHTPVDQAFGYRFDTGGGSVVFSGDTRPSNNLIQYARGVDILVHEVIYPGFGFPEYHTLSTDVGLVAARAEVGHLVLTHLLPGDREDEDWLKHARAGFPGPITVGRDLVKIT